jgi:hypothetical protein
MKRQLLVAAPDPEKSQQPRRRYRVVNRDGNADQIVDESWTLYG